MKKLGLVLLVLLVFTVFAAQVARAETNDNYYVNADTKTIWDERMLTQYPDVAYVHVGNNVDRFIVEIESGTNGPLDMTILSPTGVTVYDLYDTSPDQHDLKKLITTKRYGTGVYTVKVFHANTANIGYTITIKGPNAIGLGESDGGCNLPCTK